MKKGLSGLICLLFFLAGNAQFTVTGGDTIPVNGTTSPTQTIITTGSCANTGTDTLTLSWVIVSDTAMPGWTYTGFCDKNNCYNFVLGVPRSFTLLPHRTGILELHLTQGCIAGTGNVKFLLWNAADSAGTVQLVTFAVNITPGLTCPNGIEPVAAEQFLLYPDPVKDQLKIAWPQGIDKGKVEIFNVLGAKVYSQAVGNETIKNVDLTGFAAGIYVAVITDGSKLVAAKKFTKE